MVTNALLEGGLLHSNPNFISEKKPVDFVPANESVAGHAQTGQTSPANAAWEDAQSPRPYHRLSQRVYSISYGAVATSGNFSISFIQNTSSAMMKGLYSHEVGNISLYFGW